MIRSLIVGALLLASGVASAVQYNCQASLSHVPSVMWNGGYWIHVRQDLGGNASGDVRLTRYITSGLPHSESIRLQCVPGSDWAEFDCIERYNGVRRNELLAVQFFANGHAQLYVTPADTWQPTWIGQASCNRQF